MRQHRFITHRCFWLAGIARKEQAKHVRLPFLSTMGIQHCMDAGQDLLIPDPDYSMFGISDRAIIDVADSLMAVKKLVLKEKKLTMRELLDALDANFSGPRGEEIRQMCLAQPKYGNDISEVDLCLPERSVKTRTGSSASYDQLSFPQVYGRKGRPCLALFGGLGVGALPNGRKAFEHAQRRFRVTDERRGSKGPTAVLHSALNAGFKESHASVLNQKFSAAMLRSPESIRKTGCLHQRLHVQGRFAHPIQHGGHERTEGRQNPSGE